MTPVHINQKEACTNEAGRRISVHVHVDQACKSPHPRKIAADETCISIKTAGTCSPCKLRALATHVIIVSPPSAETKMPNTDHMRLKQIISPLTIPKTLFSA